MKERIRINQNTYLLDVDAAEKLGVLKRDNTYKIGQRFFQSWHEKTYMLCGVTFSRVKRAVLICLESGGQWTEAQVVTDYNAITQEEFDSITNQDSDFTLTT